MAVKSPLRTIRRVAMVAIIVAPITLSFVVRTARASGYMVAFDEYGTPNCTPGGNDDCP
jgi:hypothetical protein